MAGERTKTSPHGGQRRPFGGRASNRHSMKLANGTELPRVEVLRTPMPFPPQHVNPYLILAEEPIVVDTGVKLPEAWAALGTRLKEFGLAIGDIRHLLITHAHVDHYGQAKKIKEASGCKVYANVKEKPQLEREHGMASSLDSPNTQFFREWGVPEQLIRTNLQGQKMSTSLLDPIGVDVCLEDGKAVELAGVKIRPVWVPGHAIGHTVYIIDEWKCMFSADHLLPDISPVPLLNFPDPAKKAKTRSLVEWLDSLTKVEPEPIRVAFPSHGEPILDHRALIAGYRLHSERRRLKVVKHFRESGPLTAYELSAKMFGDARAQALMFLTMSEAVGYLELLEDRGQIGVEDRGGVHYYQLRPEAPEEAEPPA